MEPTLDDLMLTTPLPDDGPWRVFMYGHKAIAVSKQSGTYEPRDGALVPIDDLYGLNLRAFPR